MKNYTNHRDFSILTKIVWAWRLINNEPLLHLWNICVFNAIDWL